MKIAYIFAYFGDGGAESHAITLAKKARESGHNPLFIISKISKTALKKIQDEKFELIYLPMESSFNPAKVFRAANLLKKIIRSENIDIVHAHMLREQSLAILAKFVGGKFVLIRTFHRLDQFNWKMKPILPMYLKYTDATIAISPTMASYLDANGWRGHYSLIENGATRVITSKHDEAIGFIGRLTKEKGILAFIKANIDLLRENKLVIAGDGPDFSEIQKFAESEKLKVELMGNVVNKKAFFEKISVLILPSETEVLPLVVLEAYSCGLPVVAFDIESLKGLIGPKNGTLIEYQNYHKMGQVAVLLVKSRDGYRNVNVKLFNQKYSEDIMWGKTLKLYQSLTEKK
jgi:glycosyltransferase involved in cell wall biosynthesis